MPMMLRNLAPDRGWWRTPYSAWFLLYVDWGGQPLPAPNIWKAFCGQQAPGR